MRGVGHEIGQRQRAGLEHAREASQLLFQPEPQPAEHRADEIAQRQFAALAEILVAPGHQEHRPRQQHDDPNPRHPVRADPDLERVRRRASDRCGRNPRAGCDGGARLGRDHRRQWWWEGRGRRGRRARRLAEPPFEVVQCAAKLPDFLTQPR